MKLIRQISKACVVVAVTGGLGAGLAPVTVTGQASSLNFKQLPRAYQRTWYAVGKTEPPQPVGYKVKIKLTKTSYSTKVENTYRGDIISSYYQRFRHYTAHKTHSGAYKLTMYEWVNGAWESQGTDTVKLMTKKFNGKKYTVLREGPGHDVIYFFKNVTQAKQAKYNVATVFY